MTKYRNLEETKEKGGFWRPINENKAEKIPNVRDIAKFFQENPNIFLLNNILLGIQFFRNYERDVNILRENLFTETVLTEHKKTCFYADSIHKTVGENIKFRSRHGIKKDTEELLHPLRIFVSNDNVKAAHNSSTLDQCKLEVAPYYFLTVKPCPNEKKEKSGYVWLVLYRSNDLSVTINPNTNLINDFFLTCESPNSSEHYEKHSQKTSKPLKTPFDTRSRRLTKIEKLIAFQNKELNSNEANKQASSRHLKASGEIISLNSYYQYVSPKKRLHAVSVLEFRMNNVVEMTYQIPKKCFQPVNVKQVLISKSKATTESCFAIKNVLNSAAFKGSFCDVLIEKLMEPLNLDDRCLNDGTIQEEFVIVNQKGFATYITSVIEILDWDKSFGIEGKTNAAKISNKIQWPSEQMEKILVTLPKYLVPTGFSDQTEENLDYEKEWKIEYSKAEEYLLLHMMHAHLRCYFFVLAIYKSFIELEINHASFGPKHILHLLFWKVQKDFLAWSEDTPGETLLHFLKSLYNKLRNKSLPDFFVRSRNLFAGSYPKDLHKAQSILKMILDNPVPYVMKTVNNLKLEENFYTTLNISKLNQILKDINSPPKKINKTKKKNESKERNLLNYDVELQWRKNAIRQIQLERKIEEEERKRQSIESVDVEEIPTLKFATPSGFQLLELFIFHFLNMGLKSTEYEDLNQADMYLFHAKKLLQLLPNNVAESEKLGEFNKNVIKLQQNCNKLKKNLEFDVKLV